MAISLIGPMPSGDTGNILNYNTGPAPVAPARPYYAPPAKGGGGLNQQAAKQAVRQRWAPPPPPRRPPPPPPRPRAFRDVEQERIDRERNPLLPAGFDPKAFAGDVGGNILDLATPESRAEAMKSKVGNRTSMSADAMASLHGVSTATDPAQREAENARGMELVKQAGATKQVETQAFDPEAGGYQLFKPHEYEAYEKTRPKGEKHMRDIHGKDGVYVYMAGNTSLSNDSLGISQEEIWSHMAPEERSSYLQSRLALRNLRKDAPQRYDVALRANDIAVSAQHRYLVDERRKGTKPGKLLGGFFDTTKDSMSIRAAVQEWDEIANFLVWQEATPNGKLGMKSIKSIDEVFNAFLHDAQTDRYMAGELVLAMLNAHMIEGAQEKYVKDYVGMDKDGRPIAVWNPIDWNDNLRIMVQEIARRQQNGAKVGESMTGAWAVVKDAAAYNQQTAGAAASDYGRSGGGGGGYGGYGGRGGYGYGGGGGGENNRVFLSDPTMLGSQLDSIARARLGRVATPEERAAFIAHFHQLETQYSAAYVAGGAATQPDVQGQAVAWIESRNSGEQASETAGEFITALAQFLRGPGLSTGG